LLCDLDDRLLELDCSPACCVDELYKAVLEELKPPAAEVDKVNLSTVLFEKLSLSDAEIMDIPIELGLLEK
jgi:hypothetical protein